jgi:hypothetical protein
MNKARRNALMKQRKHKKKLKERRKAVALAQGIPLVTKQVARPKSEPIKLQDVGERLGTKKEKPEPEKKPKVEVKPKVETKAEKPAAKEAGEKKPVVRKKKAEGTEEAEKKPVVRKKKPEAE